MICHTPRTLIPKSLTEFSTADVEKELRLEEANVGTPGESLGCETGVTEVEFIITGLEIEFNQ